MTPTSILAAALAGALMLVLVIGGCHLGNLQQALDDREAQIMLLEADTTALASSLRSQTAEVEVLAEALASQALATESGLIEAARLRQRGAVEIARLRAERVPTEPDSLRHWAVFHARQIAAWTRAPPR
ncbi:MAG: hypothetical protein AAFV01_04210 [Bacteroidota bacterium]